MTSKRDFWSQDCSDLPKKTGWFNKLPPLQKTSYILLLIFIVSWCFYLGMTYAFAIAPDIEWDIKSGYEWKERLKEETGAEIARLSGVEVALLVGADKRPGETRYRTDTIILAFYNWDNDELKLLSIPRDSYVQFPGRSTKTKINEAYFYGGISLLESAIEYTLGIEVDHWVEIDFGGFLRLIDVLGGVDIDVPHRMYKPSEDINIKAGPQTLLGYDALAFVRFRDLPMGDIDRIANQQMFLRALAAKLTSSSIWKAPQLVTIGLEHTTTNYALTEALMLGTALYKTDLTNIPMYSLPGRGLYIGMVNYWVLNKKGVIDIISEIADGEVGDFHIISDEGQGTDQPPQPLEEEIEEEIIDEESEENAEAGETEPAQPDTNEPAQQQEQPPAVEVEPENPQQQTNEMAIPEPIEDDISF